MKNRDIRFVYLLILLFITAVLFATSTYAWFTVNRLVQVDSLNVKVEAAGGIDISTDGIHWKSGINGEDITEASKFYASSINQIPMKMEPVSTGGNVSNGMLEMFFGTVSNDSKGNFVITSKRDIEVSGNRDGNFIAFDLFFRVTKDTALYLTSNSGAKYTGDKIPGIENASRFAFLVLGNTNSGSSPDVIQSMRGNQGVYIWEPNYDVHSNGGVRNAYDTYGIVVNNSGNGAILYDGIVSDIKSDEGILIGKANSQIYPNLFKRVNVDYLTGANFTNSVSIFGLKSGITKVRVYIWLEGQDVDCENNSSVGNIDFMFELSANPS